MENRWKFENRYRAGEDYPEFIEHFFYFPLRSDADKAAEHLRARGWPTNVAPGADDTNWLVLATQPARGDEDMGPIWHELTAFAEEFNGVYDGWGRPADSIDSQN